MFDMSLTYILVALAAVLLNNVLVERLSLHTRITAGMLPAHLAGRSPPQGPRDSVSPCVKWARLLGMLQGSACENRVQAFVYPDTVPWGPACSSPFLILFVATSRFKARLKWCLLQEAFQALVKCPQPSQY